MKHTAVQIAAHLMDLLPGKIIDVKVTATVAAQKAFLADLDRQNAVIEAKRLGKNGIRKK